MRVTPRARCEQYLLGTWFNLLQSPLRSFSMYTVSIYNQKSGQWRSTTEKTLSACVCLTMGLVTHWQIVAVDGQTIRWGIAPNGVANCWRRYDASIVGIHVDAMNLAKRYCHAKRALLCRWVSSLASKTVLLTHEREQLRYIMRLNDQAYYAQISSLYAKVDNFNNNLASLE